jgi:hypothetical protein
MKRNEEKYFKKREGGDREEREKIDRGKMETHVYGT